MRSVLTKDLQPGMTIRHPWATVWRVAATQAIHADRFGTQYQITLRHGDEEKILIEWDWEYVEHILCDTCGELCVTLGTHTGR